MLCGGRPSQEQTTSHRRTTAAPPHMCRSRDSLRLRAGYRRLNKDSPAAPRDEKPDTCRHSKRPKRKWKWTTNMACIIQSTNAGYLIHNS
ncbi:hypothetical protein BD413DRAFT_240355 [Trametes elegans]|nr:hypothetical protein BD413DRAFT_240355 [Trametes elegans]